MTLLSCSAQPKSASTRETVGYNYETPQTNTPLPTYTPYPTFTPTPTPSPAEEIRVQTVLVTTTPSPVPSLASSTKAVWNAYSDPEFYESVLVEVKGLPLPYVREKFDPAVGLKSPTLESVLLDGTPVFIGGEGPTTILMVLAHWCPHCRNEVRELTKHFSDEGLPETVRVMSLATAIDSSRANYPPHKWLENENWPVPVIVDNPDSVIADIFGVNSFPFFIVIDQAGDIALRIPGRMGVDTLERLIEALSGLESRN